MSPIHPHVIKDTQDRPVAVVLPFSEWQHLEKLLGDAMPSTNGAAAHEGNGAAKPAQSAADALKALHGSIKFEGDAVEWQRRIRAEWDR